MMSVVGGPPEGATLKCTVAYQGKYELSSPRGGKGSMGEIAVIKSGDGKHAHGVSCESNSYSYGAPTNPENSETGQMHYAEGNDAKPFDAPLRDKLLAMGGLGIKPA